jgi:Predicted membrane protein
MDQKKGMQSRFFASLCKYLLVGGANTALIWGGVYVFSVWAHLPNALAVTCAYCLSICFHFLTNRSFTFSSSGVIHMEFKRYIALFVTNYLLTLGITHLVTEVLCLSLALGVFVSTVVTVPIGYLASYFWVYEVKK